MSALRSAGAYVQLEEVQWLPETADHETPEHLLEALQAAQARRAHDALHSYLEIIPTREALAIMLSEGLFGHSPCIQREIASYVGARSRQVISYVVRRAKERIRYLATRPQIDDRKLRRVLTEHQVSVVRSVFETASFAEAARKRWPCPDDREPKRVHAWNRRHAQRLKREFFRALAKVERAGLREQTEALQHLVANLGALTYQAGSGRR